jgi:hypothetical protein
MLVSPQGLAFRFNIRKTWHHALSRASTTIGRRFRLRRRAGAQLGGHRGDSGITIGPVIAAAGEQAHHPAVPAHDQAVAIVLDLACTQSGPEGGLAAKVGMQGATNPSARMGEAAMPAKWRLAADHGVVTLPRNAEIRRVQNGEWAA